MSRLASLMSSVALAATVVACGGGSSDSPPPPAPPPPAAGVTLVGVVAVGDALAGASVEARCRGGSTGTATTSSTGTYSITLATGGLPCVLRATPAGAGAAALHSVAQAVDTAHITPASELIVASLAGTAPASYFGGFDDSVADTLTATRVQAANASVVSLLTEGGVDFSAFGNLLTAPLTAASGGNAGNAFDQALDALAQRLAQRSLTLAALTDAVVRSSPANPTQTANTPSLPPQALLQPASPSCSALRSGTYRFVVLQSPIPGDFDTGTLELDAVAGTITNSEGDVGSFTSAGGCIFNQPNGGQFAVAPSGVVVSRALEGGVMRLSVSFPEQTHALADLAGVWQSLAFDIDSATSVYTADALTATVSATGNITANSYCVDVVNCAPEPPHPPIVFTPSPAGGFILDSGDQWTERFFAYRAGSGDLMLIGIASDGLFSIWTPRRATGPVAVGTQQRSWGVWTDRNAQSPNAALVSDFTATAADATSWTRVSAIDGHSETLVANSPRDGWVSRAEGTAPLPGGGTVAVRGFNGLVLRGMGVSALSMPTLNGGAYFLSVALPLP